MEEQFIRTQMLLGNEAMNRLHNSRVAIFGIGGVGGYAAEALARSGIGAFDLIDMDTVSVSNINRQIIATMSTVGRYKTEVMRDRILDINPQADVVVHNCFYLPENEQDFNFYQYDYIVDAVDTVTAKISIICKAKKLQIPVISSMGAGNKMDASAFEAADISNTSVCPLARVMRRELKKRGIDSLKVVYSKEKPVKPMEEFMENSSDTGMLSNRRTTPGSVSFVPPVAGLILAGEVVKDIIKYPFV
ncbi:MAG: tRNA threonylcarbamoyladenosine dehydratase [Lachnospiraceae bacterium]|nr:tRNA threonylcarbamoyladenosine dehydratase [Lachnospiraceae bacterium]